MGWDIHNNRYTQFAVLLFLIIILFQIWFVIDILNKKYYYLLLVIPLGLYQIILISFIKYFNPKLYYNKYKYDIYDYLDKLDKDKILKKKYYIPNLSFYIYLTDFYIYDYNNNDIIIAYNSLSELNKKPTVIIDKKLLSDKNLLNYLSNPFK